MNKHVFELRKKLSVPPSAPFGLEFYFTSFQDRLVYKSTDLVSFTPEVGPTDCGPLLCDGGKVVVGTGIHWNVIGTQMFWKVDTAPTWTTVAGHNAAFGLGYNAGNFLIVDKHGATYSTTDFVTITLAGITLENQGTSSNVRSSFGVANGKFIAGRGRYEGTTPPYPWLAYYIYDSVNGIAWTTRKSVTGSQGNFAVSTTDGRNPMAKDGCYGAAAGYVLGGETSADGINWTGSYARPIAFFSMAYGAGKYVAVGYTTSGPNYYWQIYNSTDGYTWGSPVYNQQFDMTFPNPSAIYPYAFPNLIFKNNKFYVNVQTLVPGQGAILESADGTAWTTYLLNFIPLSFDAVVL